MAKQNDVFTKDIKIRVRKAVGVGKNYAKSSARMFLASGKEYFNNTMPMPGAMLEANRELLADTVKFLRNPADAIHRQVDRAISSETYGALVKFAKYALDDLKTGNLYDPDRDRSSEAEEFDAMMSDFGGFDMSGFDENGDWDEPDDLDKELKTNVKIASIQEDNADRRTAALSNSITTSASGVIANNNANAQTSIRLSVKQHAQQMNALENMISSQTATFELINKSITAHLDVTREAHNQIMSEMGQLKTILGEIRDNTKPAPAPNQINARDEQEDIFGINGEINIKSYLKNVVKRIDEHFNISSYASIATAGNSIKGLLEMIQNNPWQFLTSQLIGRLIPDSTKKQMELTNRNLEGFLPSLLMKLGQRGRNYAAGKDESVAGFLGQFFGLKDRSRSGIVTEYADPLAKANFTSKTTRAVEEVIPMWLSKIYSAVSGDPLMVYNYSTGRLERAASAVARYERESKDLVGNMGDTGRVITRRASAYRFETSEEKQKFEDFVYQFLQSTAESGGFLKPNMTEDEFNDIASSLNYDSRNASLYYNLLSGIFTAMTPGQKIRMGADMHNALRRRDRNYESVQKKLFDSGLNAAWGFMDPNDIQAYASRSLIKANALSESDISNISEQRKRDTINKGGTGATNIILNDILGTLKKGIITYSYIIGGTKKRNDGSTNNSNITELFEVVRRNASTQKDVEQKLLSTIASDEEWKRRRTANEIETSRREQNRPDLAPENMYVLNGMTADRAAIIQSMFTDYDEEEGVSAAAREHRESFKNYLNNLSNGTIEEAMERTKSIQFLDTLRRMTKTPFALFEDAMKLTDAFMYKALFGEDTAVELSRYGEPFLMKILTHSLNVHFKNAKDWFAENIGSPIKNFLFNDKDGLFPRIKHALSEFFDIDGKKQAIKDKFDEVKEKFIGKKITDENGKVIRYEGGKLSSTVNRFANVNENLDNTIKSLFNRVLYGDNVDTKGIGLDESGKRKYTGVIGQFKRATESFTKMLFGDDENDDSRKKFNLVKGELNKAFPDMVVRGGMGLLAGLILPGGPLLGSLIGGFSGLVKGSDTFKEFLFGKTEEEYVYDASGTLIFNDDGTPKTRKVRKSEGLISEEVYEGVKKFFPAATKGALVGAITGGLGILPFSIGSTLGAVFGALGGIGAASDKFKEVLFGNMEDPKSGIISKEFRDKVVKTIKTNLPGTAVGAGIGSIIGSGLGLIPGLSLLPTGPIFTFFGAMTGLANADKINKFFFGTEVEEEIETPNEDGSVTRTRQKTRKGGLFGRMFDFTKDELITPVAKRFDEAGKKVAGWFDKSIIDPLKNSMKPLQDAMSRAGSSVLNAFKNIGEKITDSLTRAFNVSLNGDEEGTGEKPGLKQFFKKNVLGPLDRMVSGLFNKIGSVIGGILSAPFKAIEMIFNQTIEGKPVDEYFDEKAEERKNRREERRKKRDERRHERQARKTGAAVERMAGHGRSAFGHVMYTLFGDEELKQRRQARQERRRARWAARDARRNRLFVDPTATMADSPNVIYGTGTVMSDEDLKLWNEYTSSVPNTDLHTMDEFQKWKNNRKPEDTKSKIKEAREKADAERKEKESTDNSAKNEKANREETTRRTRRKFRSSEEYLSDILKYTKKIFNEVKGQVNGVGWNTAYIRTLLTKQYGELSDEELPEEMEGSKRTIRKKRTIFGKAKDYLSDKLGGVKDKIFGFGRKVKDTALDIWDMITNPFRMIASFVKGVKNALVGLKDILADGLKEIFTGAGEMLRDVMAGIGAGLREAGAGLGAALGDAVHGVIGTLSELTLGLASGARALMEIAADIAPDVVRGLWNLGKAGVKGLWKGAKFIGRGIKGAVSWGAGKIGSLFKKKGEKGSEEEQKNRAKRIVLDGGYLDEVKDDVAIQIGREERRSYFPWVEVTRGISRFPGSRAIPVYILGAEKAAKLHVIDDSKDIKSSSSTETAEQRDRRRVNEFKRKYEQVDRSAENSNSNPREAYDRAMRNAQSSTEIEAIAQAQQLNAGSSNIPLALPGNTESGGNFWEDLLGGGGDGIFKTILQWLPVAFPGLASLFGGVKGFLGKAASSIMSVVSPLWHFTSDEGNKSYGLQQTIRTILGGNKSFLLKMPASEVGEMFVNAVKDPKYADELIDMGKIAIDKSFGKGVRNIGTIGKVVRTAGSIVSKGKSAVKTVASKAASSKVGQAVIKYVKALLQKVLQSKAVQKVFGSLKSKISPIISKLTGFIQDKLLKQAISTTGKEAIEGTAKQLGGYATGGLLTVGFAIYDLISGMGDAYKYFGVYTNQATLGMKLTAGICNMLGGLLSLVPGPIGPALSIAAAMFMDDISSLVYSLIAPADAKEELAANQEKLKQATEAHNMATGENLTPEEYASQYDENGNKRGFWSKVGATADNIATVMLPGYLGIKHAVTELTKILRGNNEEDTSEETGKGPGLKRFSQSSSKWNTRDPKMRYTGCGPTAAAIVGSAYNAKTDPSEANSMSYQLGMRAEDGGTKPEFFDKYASTKGYTMKQGPTDTRMIKSSLDRGNPVVMMGEGGPFGGNSHYLVANDLNSKTGQISYVDPRNGSMKRANAKQLIGNTTSTIYSYGKGPTSAVALSDGADDVGGRRYGTTNDYNSIKERENEKARQTLLDLMESIKSNVAYSTSSVQDPEQGTASCASTVTWAYNKALGYLPGGSTGFASSTAVMNDPNFTTIYTNEGNNPVDLSQLKAGDIMFYHFDKKKYADCGGIVKHTEMYAGDGYDWTHGGNPHYGPVKKAVNDYRKDHLMKVRRYNPFYNGEPVTVQDVGNISVKNSGASSTTNASGSSSSEVTDTSELGTNDGNAFLDAITNLLTKTSGLFDKILNGLMGQSTEEEETDEDDPWNSVLSSESSGDTSSTSSSSSSSSTTSTATTASLSALASKPSVPLVGADNIAKIKTYLRSKGYSKYAIAGIMGNLEAESGLIPNNLQNTYNKSFGLTDSEYTEAVDKGTYDNFVNDSAGYGLAQWTYYSRKQNLLNLIKQRKVSIADLPTQLDFLNYELGQYGLINKLNSSKSVADASTIMLQQFEKPAGMYNQSTIDYRTSLSNKYYDESDPNTATALKTNAQNEVQAAAMGPGDPNTAKSVTWGKGPSTNLTALNDRISKINTVLTNVQNETKEGATVEKIANKLTTAIESTGMITNGSSGGNDLMEMMVKYMATMVELLGDIKDNTAANKDLNTVTSPYDSGLPTASPRYQGVGDTGTNQKNVGLPIIDKLTSK